jgi:hypothetical protein
MDTASKHIVDWQRLMTDLVSLLIPRSDDLSTSPVKLGVLLEICAELSALEPLVRERAISLAMRKIEIPGWTLVHREANAYVESAIVLQLVRACPSQQLPALAAALATQLGNIGETKYQALCQAAKISPQGNAVKRYGTTVFLRKNAQPETKGGE